jgi:hypothetical protein
MSVPHMKDTGPHVDELDKRLHGLSAAFADLGNTADFDALFKIIHDPGWTTWPDIFLINTLVDAAERAAKDARSVRTALVECVLAISGASAE